MGGGGNRMVGDSADVRLGMGVGEMVCSFQHLQLECTIRAGPTSEL